MANGKEVTTVSQYRRGRVACASVLLLLLTFLSSLACSWLRYSLFTSRRYQVEEGEIVGERLVAPPITTHLQQHKSFHAPRESALPRIKYSLRCQPSSSPTLKLVLQQQFDQTDQKELYMGIYVLWTLILFFDQADRWR